MCFFKATLKSSHSAVWIHSAIHCLLHCVLKDQTAVQCDGYYGLWQMCNYVICIRLAFCVKNLSVRVCGLKWNTFMANTCMWWKLRMSGMKNKVSIDLSWSSSDTRAIQCNISFTCATFLIPSWMVIDYPDPLFVEQLLLSGIQSVIKHPKLHFVDLGCIFLWKYIVWNRVWMKLKLFYVYIPVKLVVMNHLPGYNKLCSPIIGVILLSTYQVTLWWGKEVTLS